MKIEESANGERHVDEWLELLRHGDEMSRWRAVDALRHVAHPSSSIGWFLEALKDPYWPVRALAAHSIYDMAHEEALVWLVLGSIDALAEILTDESIEVGLNAAYTLELLGPRAKTALPSLRQAVDRGDERLSKAATDAIVAIDV